MGELFALPTFPAWTLNPLVLICEQSYHLFKMKHFSADFFLIGHHHYFVMVEKMSTVNVLYMIKINHQNPRQT